MTQITPKLIEQSIKKCNEHMKAHGLSKKTRDSYESIIRRFLFWERENWNLRVKDICFDEGLIAVQEGKGDKSRLVDMSRTLVNDLKVQ
ncbi:MAG: hypothetical protein HYV59_06750 [Planctomycetes bacterium]|nr:hypothetical protein [Planctomycetota bacterium]